MKSNPGTVFEIQCFPDVETTQQSALEFTENRAKTLKNLFVSNGIAAERISVKGSGGIDPENPIPQGRAAKGRRYVGSTYLIIVQN
jgi:outer membrane protein OmpA-like peptidoglycan-associated protein